MRPIIPLTKSPGVKRGDHKTPTCKHGAWRFAGSDSIRRASKWRCPTGECKPASTWIKAERMFPLIPRDTPRWKAPTAAALLSSASSGGSSMSGRSPRSASVGWIGYGSTPT